MSRTPHRRGELRASLGNWRHRWIAMGATWCVVAALILAHTAAIRDHLDVVRAAGLRGKTSASTPFSMAYMHGAIDGMVWTSNARELLAAPSLRVRHTDADNAPFGRPVHWNSAWAWIIAQAGVIDHQITGDPLPQAQEHSTLWLSPLVLFTFIVGFSAYAARRGGTAAGIAVAIAMVGHEYFFDGFLPSYVDHHGLLNAAVFGLVLGAVFMGAGWRRESGSDVALLPESARAQRTAAVFSAACGAIGLWLSAASAVPPIAIVGFAGAVAALVAGPRAIRAGLVYEPYVWRLWGRVGAAASVLFYVLEYFPSHIGLRLEVNHPLYALAWLGGGELIAELTQRRFSASNETHSGILRVLIPAALIVLAPVTSALGGAGVFAPLDPFLSQMHTNYIREFAPLWNVLDAVHWNPYFSVIGIENAALLAGLGVLVAMRRNAPLLIWFATLVTLAFTAMAWMQMRWLMNASGPQICLTLVLVTHFLATKPARAQLAGTVAVFCILFAPMAVVRVVDARAEARERRIEPKEGVLMLYRDIAAALRAAQPSGDLRVLASPNASPSLNYYGQFKTVGTFYWENVDGLKAAAAIFSARDPQQAETLIRERGITHIAMVTEEDFLAPYYHLSHPEASAAEVEQSFGHRLLYKRAVPRWLRAIPYAVPEDLRGLDVHVRLFAVAFNQTADESLYHVALAELALGELLEAERNFNAILAHNDSAHLAWLGKGSVLYAKHDWEGSATAGLNGIARAPVAERRNLTAWLATSFMRAQQPQQVMRVYRHALREGFDAEIGSALAYLLATSDDPAQRNGREAIALAKRAVAMNPDVPAYLLCFAAALAEGGQFDAAVAEAERALKIAETERDGPTWRKAQAMITAFRAGRAWRN